jgi:DNA-binding Xre family transcriptional regulator
MPKGVYLAHITESDMAVLQSGNGEALKLTFEVLDGQFKKRRIWESLNVVHNNEQAQGIAQSQLSAICRATGVNKLEDTAALHFKPIKIHVDIQPPKGDFKEKNVIKGYEPASSAAPVQSPVAPQPSAPAANTAAKSAPAWAKKAA